MKDGGNVKQFELRPKGSCESLWDHPNDELPQSRGSTYTPKAHGKPVRVHPNHEPTCLPVPLLEDRGTSAHNMGTCPLARLSLLSMLNHGFVIEAVHGHESNITWSRRARQEDRGTGAHNMGTCPLTRLSPRG